MILIKDRHNLHISMVCSVGIFGKYDTYKGSTPKPPITIVSSSIIGKYDAY